MVHINKFYFSCFIAIIMLYFYSNGLTQTGKNTLFSGINDVYNIKFDSAEIKFKQYILENPKDPAGYFFSGMIIWWKINLNKNDEIYDNIFIQKARETIRICDEILDKNPRDFSALFFKGGIIGYRGLIKSLRNSWLQAAEDGKHALNLLQEAIEIEPSNKDALLGIGIYNYFAEFVPEKYPLIKPLMIIFPSGDKVKGLLQIKESSINAVYAKTESIYILAYINLMYEKNFAEAEIYSKQLIDLYPDNPIFEKYLYSSYTGQGKYVESLTGWEKIIAKSNENKVGYNNKGLLRESYYYCALSNLKLGEFDKTKEYLDKCETLNNEIDNEDTSFKVFTILMKGMLFDKLDKREEAVLCYKRVLDMKNFSNSHDEAEKLLERPYK